MLAEHIAARMEELGHRAELVEGNLLLNPGAEFWVATHLDTLSVSGEFRVSGGVAFGSGVCDAKAGIAAMLLALEKIEELRLGFALLVEEETSGRGSALVVERFSPRRCVVLEPTSLRIATEQYGGVELSFRVTGRAAHAAVPERGSNAIERAFELLEKLRELPARVTPFRIEGGGDIYAVPESCTLVVDLIFPPGVSLEEVRRRAIAIGRAYGSVEVVEEEEAFTLEGEASELLEEALRRQGVKPLCGSMPSWCDASNFKKAGWDVVVFGPGELAPCHTHRERVRLEEVLLTSRVIGELNELLGE
ncbi:MAG: M20/M25/M40 family metallo-hydrolase [Euryarchaeota archaeon]|nr:M20/M25/M40 family metallo-hydrolase [Euryarchaeota archaeon]